LTNELKAGAVGELLIDQEDVVFVRLDSLEAFGGGRNNLEDAIDRASASAISTRAPACGSSSTMRIRTTAASIGRCIAI
jgi:hypothetical protein